MQIYVNIKAIFVVMNTTWVEVKILSAVQMCDFRKFTVIYLPLREFFRNQHNDQLPLGF